MRELPSLKKQAGLSIIETVIAIIIGLIVIAGVFVLVGRAFSGNKISSAEQDILALRTNVKQLYAGQANFTGLANSVVVNGKLVPNDMLNGTSIVDQWNGAVTVTPDAVVTSFDITLTNVPTAACVQLATFAAGQWVDVTVGGTQVQGVGFIGNTTSAASTACAGSNVNTITWVAD